MLKSHHHLSILRYVVNASIEYIFYMITMPEVGCNGPFLMTQIWILKIWNIVITQFVGSNCNYYQNVCIYNMQHCLWPSLVDNMLYRREEAAAIRSVENSRYLFFYLQQTLWNMYSYLLTELLSRYDEIIDLIICSIYLINSHYVCNERWSEQQRHSL